MAEKVRVFAVPGEPPVQYRTAERELVHGRFIARARTEPFDPLPEGEEVIQTVEVLKDIKRGHLSLTPPVQTKQEPASAPSPQEPTGETPAAEGKE